MSKLKPAVGANDHAQGAASAKLTLVEYGDYQCPHCGRAYPIIKKVQERMGNDLRFVFRNFPLAEIHPNATNAAIATEAAAKQGKFWEMHDVIYENQENLDDTSLVNYAKRLGINLQQFQKDFDDEAIQGKVEADFESGVRSGVNGTPSFFVNGEKWEGDWTNEEAFYAALQGMQ